MIWERDVYHSFDNIRMSKSKSRKKINSYVIRLDEPLGEGAYAKVFRAHEDHTNSFYAVKVIERAMSNDMFDVV